MSDLYLYTPDVCDGDLCVMDCDRCPKRHIIEDLEADRLEDDDALAAQEANTDAESV